jgi:hypothetical protein
MGAMTSMMAPPTARSALPRSGPEGRLTGGRRPCPRCGSTSRGFKKEAAEAISAPKQAPFPHPPVFGLAVRFIAGREGAEGADHRTRLSAKAMPPLGQYFSLLLKKVLPTIQDVQLRRLVKATGLLLRYCSQIRRGERVPHPRHWEALRRAGEPSFPSE